MSDGRVLAQFLPSLLSLCILSSQSASSGVNKLRKKAKLLIGTPVDVYFADEDPDCALPTADALYANAALLEKANVFPVPMSERHPRYAQSILSDLGPAPFGSKCLRIVLCRPTPTLSERGKQLAAAEGGAPAIDALQGVVAATAHGKDCVVGTLDGRKFELRRGIDFFGSATEKLLAARQAVK